MKNKKAISIFLSLVFVMTLLPLPNVWAANIETTLWTENFEGASDGSSLSDRADWEMANSYVPSGESNNNTYTIKQDGSNMVANFVKGPNAGQSRQWAARAIQAPEGTEKITISFKIRSNSGTGSLEVGFANGNQWAPNGNLRISFDSNQLLWRPGMGSVWTSEARMGATGSWNDILIVVEPKRAQNGNVRGFFSVTVNGQSRGGDWMNSGGLSAAYTPTALGLGWVRTQSVGADLDIDDITVSAAYSVPFELSDKTVRTQIEPEEPLRLTFSGAIDAASLASARISLDDPDIFVAQTAVAADDPNSLLVTFNRSLAFEKSYVLSVSGISESGGLAMTPTDFEFKTRARRTNIETPRFYQNYGSPSQQALTSFSEGTVTTVLNYQNENEPFSATALVAVTKDNRLVKLSCQTANVADTGNLTLSVDTTGGSEMSVYLWKSLTTCEPFSRVVTLSSQGLHESEFVQAAKVTSLKADMKYDSYQLSVKTEGESGDVGMLLLKPGYTPEGLTAEAAQEAVLYVSQAELEKTFTYTYDPAAIIAGQYAHTVLAGGKTATVQLFSASVLGAALSAVQSTDAKGLAKLLAGERSVVDGVLLNDVLGLSLTDYSALKNQEAALTAVAGKSHGTIEALKTALQTAISAQAEKEKQQAALLASVNSANWDELEALLTEGSQENLIELDFDGDYKKLSRDNRVLLYKHLAEDETFASLEAVSTAFDKWVDALSESASVSRPSGGGGGGGSSSKGGTTMSFPAATTKPTQTPSETAPTQSFSDCEAVSWAKDAIEALAKQNIINGTGDGHFEPEKSVTREAFLKMLVLALELKGVGATPFKDVPQDAWYAPYVAAAVDNGLISGVSETSFGVGSYMSRADMAVVCARALALKGITLSQTEAEPFSDSANIPSYAAESVRLLQCAGLMNGVGDNCFEPYGTTNRAMAAKMIYSLIQMAKGE